MKPHPTLTAALHIHQQSKHGISTEGGGMLLKSTAMAFLSEEASRLLTTATVMK